MVEETVVAAKLLPAPVNRPPNQFRPWLVAAAVTVVLLAGLGLTEAAGVTNLRGTVIRLFAPDGTLVVEVDDPGVSVSIDGEEMVISGTGAKEIRLRPGQYKVLASKDGKLVRQELVTVTRNGRQVVRVSKEAAPRLVSAKAEAGRRAVFTRGDWRVVGDVIEHPDKDKQAMLLFGGPDLGDGDFTCEIQRDRDGNGVALVARASDLENYYYFEIGSFGNQWHSIYAKETGTNWRRIDQKKAAAVPADRWVSVCLKLRGDAFQCFVDDQLVLSGKDDRRLKGYIGLRTWNEAGKFRNVQFTSPDGAVLWQGVPEIPVTAKP
jgi:hypothetical protein